MIGEVQGRCDRCGESGIAFAVVNQETHKVLGLFCRLACVVPFMAETRALGAVRLVCTLDEARDLVRVH